MQVEKFQCIIYLFIHHFSIREVKELTMEADDNLIEQMAACFQDIQQVSRPEAQ